MQESKYQSSKFKFDRVFSQAETQVDVFNEVKDLIRSTLDGFNVCIFAYGQTGTGKTFTMEGNMNQNEMGLVPRSVEMIFDTLDSYSPKDYDFVEVSMSCIEVYIEKVRDLLDESNFTSNKTEVPKFKPSEAKVQ